jgi:PBP1b-binding outer membrane lipoprotein LpoB
MKKFLLILFIVVIFSSCVSMQDRQITAQEKANINVIGTVSTQFTSFQFFHIPSKSIIKKAHQELLKKAQNEYAENVEIRNIVIEGNFSLWQLVYGVAPALIGGGVTIAVVLGAQEGSYSEHPEIAFVGFSPFGLNIFGNFQKITATGDVVINKQGLEEALSKAAEALTADLPQNATVAILNVMSSNFSTAEYAVNELEYKLVESKKFRIVDRRRIDQIRREQNFQLSGDVDDNSAVSIGKILGARIVITGSINSSGNSQWLYLRVLDVQTGQIIKMVREQF